MPQATLPPILVADGQAYTLAGKSGTIGAALAAGSVLFALRALDNVSGATAGVLSVAAVRLAVTTITAFTVPITAGRELAIARASGTGLPAAANGSSSLAPAVKSNRDKGANTGLTTDLAVIAGTGALGAIPGAGAVEANRLGILDLVANGAAGARVERSWLWASERGRVDLAPGELLVVYAPTLFDAAGTFQVAVEVDYTRRDL